MVFISLALIALSVKFCHDPAELSSKASPPASRTPSLAGKSVTVLTNQPHARSSEALAEWFYNETGAVVRNIVVNYEDMLRYTLADVSSPSPRLDVVMFWYVDLGALVEYGALMDLTDFIKKNRAILHPNDFIPSLNDPYTFYKGRRWALPYDGDTHVLFYRKSMLRKYGLIPPKTWDDYSKIAETITENEKVNGIYGTAIMAPPVSMIILSSFMNRLGCYGGGLLDKDGKPTVNSDAAVTALTSMVKHCRYALPTPLETDWEVSRDAFLNGKVAMVEQWTDIGVMAEDPTQSIIQGDWGVVQMPMGKGPGARHAPALNAGFSIGISSKAPDPVAARAYLLFSCRPDIALRLNLMNGGMDPTRFSVLESAEYKKTAPELSVAVQAAIEKATPWPTVPRASQLLNILKDNLISALEGHKTPRQALDKTQKQWEKILETKVPAS